MSVTRRALGHSDDKAGHFVQRFGFFLDGLDRLYSLQKKPGFGADELDRRSEADQKLYKGYLFLTTAADTTAMGALRLVT